jgi:flagellar M-ring protein FliF
MAEINSIDQVVTFFKRLSMAQKIMLGTVVAGAVIAILVLVSVLNRPTYATLYSNLNPEDASKIVNKLKEKAVPYELEDGGKTIQVPKQQIYDLRLSFAGEGLPQSSIIGYEIFDRTNLGVSDFVQKINYRRALEGELARTILQLEEVEGTRVHIAAPEKALFKEDERPTTASVVLKLKTGRPLKKEVVQGISHLISSSVEGLDPSNVTIVDSRGILLSDNSKQNALSSLSSSQYEMQQKVESYLSSKVQNILEGVVGMGNALVQVSADLDFRQAEKTLEEYDPDKTAIRSEQVSEEKSASGDSLPPSSRNNTVTNYEINKSVEHIIESVGAVKRISVAAMINGTQKTVEKNGQKDVQYTPRKQEDIDQMSEVVKRTVGFDPQRGDQVSVVNMQFGNSLSDGDFVYKETPWSNWPDLAQKIFLIIAMIAAVFIVKSLLGRVRAQTADSVAYEGTFATKSNNGISAKLAQHKASLDLPSPEDEISEEAMLREGKRKRIADYMKEKPEDAVRLLKVWLAEE